MVIYEPLIHPIPWQKAADKAHSVTITVSN